LCDRMSRHWSMQHTAAIEVGRIHPVGRLICLEYLPGFPKQRAVVAVDQHVHGLETVFYLCVPRNTPGFVAAIPMY